jgi:transcription elongation factor GreA
VHAWRESLLLWPGMAESEWLAEWDSLVASGDAGAIEGAWLARLEAGVGDGVELVEALRRLRAGGKKTLAATLLELAAEEALDDREWAARKLFLSELIRLGIGDQERWKEGLEACVRQVWSERPSLDRLLDRFPLRAARKPLDVLDALENWLEHDIGEVFAMAGRGAGRVVEANPQLGTLRLDFEHEKRVPIPIEAARKFLEPLPPGHFLRRRLEGKAVLVEEAAADPPATLAAVLESFGTPMSVSQLKAALAGVVGEAQWTSWWNKARKHRRVVSAGSGARITYHLAGEEGAAQEIRAQFAAAPLARKIELARHHASRSRELGATFVAALAAGGGDEAAAPGTAWEALALARRLGAAPGQIDAAQRALLARVGERELLGKLADPAQREAVLDLAQELGERQWVGVWSEWLDEETNPRVLSHLATRLIAAGESGIVQVFVDRIFLDPIKAPAAFVWACELDGPLASLVDEKRSGALLVRLVELAERRAFTPLRARLKELLSAGGLAGRIVQERLTAEQGRRILQILERPGELAAERNWLRRAVVARFTDLRQPAAADVVPALAATVVRLQEELRDMLEKQIPETLRAIQAAKEHGDLSENFEYHAARARQEYLSARAAALQADLAKVRVVDPATIDTRRVRVGTRVWLQAREGEASRSIVILGPYEADAERGVLSHGSEAAQALLEHAPGDTVKLEGASWTVERIEPAS